MELVYQYSLINTSGTNTELEQHNYVLYYYYGAKLEGLVLINNVDITLYLEYIDICIICMNM